MSETSNGDNLRHDAATFNEVNALINRDGEEFVPFTQRMAITNRFLDWHKAKVSAVTEEIAQYSDKSAAAYQEQRARAEANGQPTIGYINLGVAARLAAENAREIGKARA